MQESPESVEFFQTLLNPEKPITEADTARAMIAAARETCWRRNQACDAVIARGAVACILGGAVRKFAVRPNGQRQIIDVIVTGDFLGFAPSDPAFVLEAVSNDTRIASFTREQIDLLESRFPAVSALMQNCAADAIRRLEHHLLVQSRITAREKVGAYLAAMTRRMKRNRSNTIVLPVTRYDIADHLGIAVETVSRTMTVLRRRGSITLRTPRDIEIRDESMLSDTYC
jgi:CRP-like cAMP-binding protein